MPNDLNYNTQREEWHKKKVFKNAKIELATVQLIFQETSGAQNLKN